MVKTIVIPVYNATFYDANAPYCQYVVNAPPCYDLKTGTVVHWVFYLFIYFNDNNKHQ